MQLIILFGPPAVGKMTVGKALEKRTGLKLFHNHMTIELVVPFFDFGTEAHNRLVRLFRWSIFESVAKSDLKGLIFTFVWAFGLDSEETYVDEIVQVFQAVDADIMYVELEATLSERLWRNKTEERLLHKPTKRDTEASEKILLEHEATYRFNSYENEFTRPNYLKINNTHLSPEEVATQIITHFGLS
ncbi:MAG: AAA family ATPase [Bacteroidetes Order II. Incertae sedis bacterium]|nr:AAA family ATPase [Bacteroidetes Order II. bacterium]